MAKKVTTALIGCGGRGVQAHGAHAIRSDKIQLVAVCDLDEARRVAAAGRLGVPAVGDYRELLARPDLESVIIATATRAHVPIALDCVAAGKHVLVEKPLATDAAAARQLAEAADRRGVVGLVGYQLQFTAFAQAVKGLVEEIDPVQALLTVQRGPLQAQYFVPDHYGGIVDTATHTIFLALWLMGRPPEAVYGSVHRGSLLGDETLEAINLSIEFDGGRRTATVLGSQIGPQAMNLLQFIGRRGHVTSTDRQRIQVVTHTGLTPGDPRARAADALQARVVEVAADQHRATGAMLDHFAERISGTATSQQGASFWDGARAVAVTQAMVAAAQTGRRVSLSSL